MRGYVIVALLSVAATLTAQAPPYDLLFRNGRLVDGSGNPWYRGDVAIRGDTIVRIAPSISEPATRVVDVGGQVIAPGFIDIHSHARANIFNVPTADNYVRQGVTTLIEGPDGSSPVPLAPFLARLETLRKSVNIGSFIGQGSIRSAVIGETDRKPTTDELERMRALVEQGMKDGAFGLSSGLFYVPGVFSSTEEVTELAKVAGRFGGIYISHMRDETSHVVDSGVDASIDEYPYTASSTSIQAALLPAWAQEGGRERVLTRLKNPATRADIKSETVRIIREERGGGDPRNIVVAGCEWNASLAGKNLTEITQLRGMAPTLENAAEAGIWLVEQGNCQGIFHAINEQDLERILRHPATMIGSDGEIPTFGKAAPHPRSYGTFARVLAVYVRERNTITLEDAVRKMTGFPAQRLSLLDRGLLRPGMKADVTVFDPARVRDTATFDKPHQYAEGFSYVVVNGEIVFDGKAMTSARPGRVLYGRR